MNWQKYLKGKVLKNELLSRHTTFGIGGPAEFFIQAQDIADLKFLLNSVKRYKLAFKVIGRGSNILVTDIGIEGITLSLDSPYFRKIHFRDDCVEVGSAKQLKQFIQNLRNVGLSGAEFLAGIPGTIGGALAMNAGVILRDKGRGTKRENREIKVKSIGDLVERVRLMDYNGNIRDLDKKEIRFGYRSSNLSKYIILGARLKLKKAKKKTIDRRIKGYLEIRKANQDYSYPSAGCVFKNPPANPAARLIDLCGLKGKRIGKAAISLKHANFIVNLGKAQAKDVLRLINLIRKEVKNKFNIDLETEIKIWK